jgi:hypothetical protein
MYRRSRSFNLYDEVDEDNWVVIDICDENLLRSHRTNGLALRSTMVFPEGEQSYYFYFYRGPWQ